MKKNNQKGRRSEKELAERMLDLIEAGRNEEEIICELGITFQQARSIHYRLLMGAKLPIGQLNFSKSRRTYVTERGVFIPRSRFVALGLDNAFPAGTPVGFSARGNSLVVWPIKTGNRRVQKETVRPEASPLAISWDGFTGDAIAMGESNEPVA